MQTLINTEYRYRYRDIFKYRYRINFENTEKAIPTPTHRYTICLVHFTVMFVCLLISRRPCRAYTGTFFPVKVELSLNTDKPTSQFSHQ